MSGRMLSREELSKLIDVPIKTLRNWSTNWEIHRKGPRPIKLGPSAQSRVRYRWEDYLRWQEKCANGEYDTNDQIEVEYVRQKAS
jgi:hypothetical protein